MGMESVGSDVMSLERYGAVQFWKAKWRTAEEDLGTAAMRIEELEAELARLRDPASFSVFDTGLTYRGLKIFLQTRGPEDRPIRVGFVDWLHSKMDAWAPLHPELGPLIPSDAEGVTVVRVDPVPAGGHRVEIRELHDPLDGVGATVVDCIRT